MAPHGLFGAKAPRISAKQHDAAKKSLLSQPTEIGQKNAEKWKKDETGRLGWGLATSKGDAGFKALRL